MWRWILGLVCAGAVVALYNSRIEASVAQGRAAATAEYKLLLAKQAAQAQQTLMSEQDKVRETERALRALKDQQEVKDAQNQQVLAVLGARLRSLLDESGRLRDPYGAPPPAGPGCGAATVEASASTSGGADDGAQAGGLLSKPLSGLLQRIAEEADAINIAYISCRADSLAQRAQEH